jgi:hypothetical protein
MSKSRQRLLEISDLLLDVSKALNALVSGDPYVHLRFWSEKAAELKHYASDLVSISGAVRQQDENMAVMQGQLNHLSPGPCKNGMINTEAENANRNDVIPAGMGAESITDDLLEDWERTSMIKDRFEAIEKRIDDIDKMLYSGIAVDIPALEIDAMSESEIDKAIRNDGVDPEALVERIEKKIRKKVN